MAKIALLIGVSDYLPGLKPLPSAIKDAEAMAKVLEDKDIGGFDEVKVLRNPGIIEMSTDIQIAFSSNRHRDDLILLFFSGHGIKDERIGELYLSSHNTCNTPQGGLNKATAIRSSFLHELMENCRSKHQVVILDCCFSGAFVKGMITKSGQTIDLAQLGGEGRAILASSSALQYSFENQGSELSIYTQYLVEGMTTGAADEDNDGFLSIDELHQYAKCKVRESAPSMKPEIHALEEGFKILLATDRGSKA